MGNEAIHNNYLKINPFAAKKKFINLYSTGVYQHSAVYVINTPYKIAIVEIAIVKIAIVEIAIVEISVYKDIMDDY